MKWSTAEICIIQLKDRSLKGHSVVGCKIRSWNKLCGAGAASLELPKVLISVQDLCGIVLNKREIVIMISLISILFIRIIYFVHTMGKDEKGEGGVRQGGMRGISFLLVSY